jgi:hypothetical protein
MTTDGGVSFEHITARDDDDWSGLVPGVDEQKPEKEASGLTNVYGTPLFRAAASTAAAALIALGVWVSNGSGQVSKIEVPSEPDDASGVIKKGSLAIAQMPVATPDISVKTPEDLLTITPEDLQKAKIYEGIYILPDTSLSYRIYLEKALVGSPLTGEFMIGVNKLLEIASANADPEIRESINNDLFYIRYQKTGPSDYPITVTFHNDAVNSRTVVLVTFAVAEEYKMPRWEIMKDIVQVYAFYVQIQTELRYMPSVGILSFRTALLSASQGVTYDGYIYMLNGSDMEPISEVEYDIVKETLNLWAKRP